MRIIRYETLHCVILIEQNDLKNRHGYTAFEKLITPFLRVYNGCYLRILIS